MAKHHKMGMPRARLTGSRPHMRRQKMSVEGHTAFSPPKNMAFPSTPGGGAAFPQAPAMGAPSPDAGMGPAADAGPAPPMPAAAPGPTG